MKKRYFTHLPVSIQWLFSFILVVLAGINYSFGQGISCATAVPVNVNTEYTVYSITDNIVNDPTEGAINGQTMQRDGWFSFVASGAEASIRVVTGNRNPMIFAYSGTCGVGLSLIGSVNALTGTGGHTEILNLTGLLNASTYYVRIGNSTNNNMPISSFHILTNDRCANPVLLTSNTTCTTISGSTLGATDNNETGDCTTGTENAVWYEFQAVATSHTVTVDGFVGFDPVVQVLNNCGAAGNPTGGTCVDVTGDGGIETRTITGLTIGNFYKIQVHDWQGDLMANGFTICVTHTAPPTITSLGATSGCVGSSLVINGTNLTGATAVTIGGTAVTAITGNTATTVTVTIGAGTTGTVQVTTPGGSATSAATFTVNPLPTAIGGGAATVCTGATTPAFTNATAGGTWSITNGSGSATVGAATGIVTGVTAGNVTVVYTLPTTCSVTRALTIQQTPGAVAGGATTVCNGASTPAFTNPNGGGTWSVVNGTGAATITGGGVLTGTSAGTVTVNYTIGTCTPATFNVTVNPNPAAIGGGAATVCTGATTPAFTNATGGGTWSVTNGTGSATVGAATGIVTGVTVGTATVVYTVGTCSRTTPITIVTTPTISTNPASVSIAPGANTSFTVVATNTPTSYTWEVSTNGGGTWTTVTNGGVYSTATTATLTITGATLAMNGYLYRATATNSCGTSAFSTNATLTVSNQVLVSGAGVNNVACGDNTLLKDHAGDANYANTRNDWSIINAGLGATITLTGNYNTENTWDFIRIYNGSGIGGTLLATFTGAGAINYTGTPGQTLTLQFTSDGSNVNTGFAINVAYSGVCFPVCTTPTAQPTTLNLAPSGNSISGSFTAASPVADSYLVVISTSAIPPSAPVNGTTYTIGGVLAPGYTIVDTDGNTTFTATGLSLSTTYYFYIYAFNSLCTGGPLYLGTSPLTGNVTTLAVNYCTPTTSTTSNGLYISQVSIIGTLNDPGANNSTFAAPMGYQDFTGLAGRAIQAAGEGVNLVATSDGVTLVRGAWKAWIDWNKDGDFNDAGELVYNIFGFVGKNITFGFVIPAGTTPGDYRIRIRVNNGVDMFGENYGFDFNSCQDFGTSGANTYYGEAEDYLFTVIANCASKITSVTPGSTCGTGTVALSAVGTGATQYRWYDSEFGGALLATTATGSWTTPSIATTTTYWVTSFNGTCESVARTAIKAVVKKTSTLSFVTSNPEVCGENSIISLTASGTTEEVHLINETFEVGGLGTFSNINNDANNATIDGNTSWTNRTSTHVPNTNVFFPAISSGFGTNRFALAYSDALNPNYPTNNVINYLALTNSVNTTGFLNLNLRLKFYYSRYFDNGVNAAQEQVTLEVSTDGGTTYPTILDTFTADTGIGSRFSTLNYVLPGALLNQANLKIRVRHHSNASATGWLPDGVAVDDIELYGDRPLSPNFTWSGASLPDAYTDVACTIPYVAGTPAATVWIKPTLAQLEMGSYSFTANANLSNGCTTSAPITITNKSKVWKGTVSNDWNNAANWLPTGVPDINTCVVVPPAPNTNILNTGAAGLGKNLSVKTGGDLDIQGGNNLTIKETVNVDAGGLFNIQNNGSLVQIDNVANTVAGTFSYKRNAITNSYLDYVYWSTPVAGFSVNNITPAAIHRYLWNPTTASSYTSNFGNWAAASGAMTTGRGYIVRGSSGTSSFNGVPNNGNITVPITRSTYLGAPYAGPTTTMVTADDDNWNLLGNPYPSAINADDFLAANSSNLNQFIKIWTHGIDPSSAIIDPFYQDYQLNYNTADYITYNALGGTQFGYDGKIGAGQGFFTLMNDANSTAENVVFNNAMRSSAHRNDQFYKTVASIEKNRIWLKLIHSNNSSIDALVGYATGATNSIDATYDTKCVGVKTTFEIYSIAENKGLLIQGRALPFDTNDTIPLGVTIPQNGIYTIAINAVDGLFQNATQEIYLEDLALGTVHNLRAAPYTFTGTTGVNENRFVLKFNNQTLNNTNFDYSNEVSIFTNNSININSTTQSIKDVIVYDILGKVLIDRKNIGKQEVSLNELKPTTNVLIVKVTLDNGKTVMKKVIY